MISEKLNNYLNNGKRGKNEVKNFKKCGVNV
jgi:hypothetical protein